MTSEKNTVSVPGTGTLPPCYQVPTNLGNFSHTRVLGKIIRNIWSPGQSGVILWYSGVYLDLFAWSMTGQMLVIDCNDKFTNVSWAKRNSEICHCSLRLLSRGSVCTGTINRRASGTRSATKPCGLHDRYNANRSRTARIVVTGMSAVTRCSHTARTRKQASQPIDLPRHTAGPT